MTADESYISSTEFATPTPSAWNSLVPPDGTSTMLPTRSSTASILTAQPTQPKTSTLNNQAAETLPSISAAATPYSGYLTSTASSSIYASTSTPTSYLGDGNNHAGFHLVQGARAGIVLGILGMVVLIVFASVWCCCRKACCCCRKRRHATQTDAGGLPLYTVQNGRNTQPGVNRAAEGGFDAPPAYAEAAPPQHQTVAGGMRSAEEVQRIEEEGAVVSDGKMPLSEIPFEDVVLEQYPSESESSGSRGFEARHHAMGGDTTGHTNT